MSLSQSVDLLSENKFRRHVVGKGRAQTYGIDQRGSRDRALEIAGEIIALLSVGGKTRLFFVGQRPFLEEAFHQFADDVLAVRGAAAVAAAVDHTSVFESFA